MTGNVVEMMFPDHVRQISGARGACQHAAARNADVLPDVAGAQALPQHRVCQARPGCAPGSVTAMEPATSAEPFDPPGEPWVRVSPRLATLRRLADGVSTQPMRQK